MWGAVSMEIQKYRNTFAIKLLPKAYNQHQGAHPTEKYRNTEIHSVTKLLSKHTTIVLNEALTADLGDLFT